MRKAHPWNLDWDRTTPKQSKRSIFPRLHGNVYSYSAMKSVPKCFRCWHKTAMFLKLLPNLFKTVTDHKWRANFVTNCWMRQSALSAVHMYDFIFITLFNTLCLLRDMDKLLFSKILDNIIAFLLRSIWKQISPLETFFLVRRAKLARHKYDHALP